MTVKTLAGATCAISAPDTTYSPVATNSNPALSTYVADRPSDRPTFFRVTRVVGPGTPGEYEAALGGQIANELSQSVHTQYALNRVVGNNAEVALSAQLILTPQFYAFLAVSGLTSVAAEAVVTFRMNGRVLGSLSIYNRLDSMPSQPVAKRAEACYTFPSSYLRFGRKSPTNLGGPCPFTMVAGDTTCPGVNEVNAYYK